MEGQSKIRQDAVAGVVKCDGEKGELLCHFLPVVWGKGLLIFARWMSVSSHFKWFTGIHPTTRCSCPLRAICTAVRLNVLPVLLCYSHPSQVQFSLWRLDFPLFSEILLFIEWNSFSPFKINTLKWRYIQMWGIGIWFLFLTKQDGAQNLPF